MNNSYISKFDDYMKINEKNETEEQNVMTLYVSSKLLKILQKIKSNPIAEKILGVINDENHKFDISYLDVMDKDSKLVGYFPESRISRIEIDLSKKPNDNDIVWTSNLRLSMNWGKIVNKIFPGVFSNMDINDFYDRYKPEVENDGKDSKFELVSGEDIRYWYDAENWDGELGSCMRHKKCQPFLDIYCNNPEKCSMLIHYSEKNRKKIIGRALVWNDLIKPRTKVGENDYITYTLMDRVYY